MVEFFKILAQRAGQKMMQNPSIKLGADIMAGNAGQGFQDFAQRQYGPAMQMGRSLLSPESTTEQRADAASNLIFGGDNQPRRAPMPQMAATIPELLPMQDPNLMGQRNMRPNTSRMQISQGLPQGILPLIMG